MRWMMTLVVVTTLGLVYWLGTRIYWWRKAFDGTAWTVTSEGASESLYAAGVLGLNDLTVTADGVGKGSLPEPGTSGSFTRNGAGGTTSSSSSSSSSTAEQAGDCDVELNAWQRLLRIGVEAATGNQPEDLAAWCRCQDRTYWEFFNNCDTDTSGWNG